ncbi:MAG: glycosyltransferase family 39 protein [Saprospiraceae bacterium]|nr:glycosyltransferase family 39 protein [Saprospiraceae bacterium]
MANVLKPLPVSDRAFDILFLATLGIFALLKLPDLGLPFYWDESWSYAPALHLMSERIPSLLPGAIPEENYRGHPLLYYFLAGWWLKIFGVSKVSFHSFGLAITLSALSVIYLMGKRFFSPAIGWLTAVLCMVQGLFFAQANMVLPEIAVTALVLLSYYFYFQQRWKYYLIAASALLLTKESGVVLLAAIVIGYTLECVFDGRTTVRQWLGRSLLLCLPITPYLLFLLLQKNLYGWAFHPDHVGYMAKDWPTLKKKIDMVFDAVFVADRRRVLIYLLGVGGIVALLRYFKNKNWSAHHAPTIHFLVFVVLYIIFSALNFFTFRYIIVCIPMVIYLALYWLNGLERPLKWTTLLIALVSGGILLSGTLLNTGAGDVNPGYKKMVLLQQQGVQWMEQNVPVTANIGVQDFVVANHLKHFRTGMLSGPDKEYKTVVWEINGNTDYCIFTATEYDPRKEQLLQSGAIELAKRFEDGTLWWEIYRIKAD